MGKLGFRPVLSTLHRNALFGGAVGIVIGIVLTAQFFTIFSPAVRAHDELTTPAHPNPDNHEATAMSRAATAVSAPSLLSYTGNAKTIFVGVLSHPRNVKRRAHLRENCFPILRDEAHKRGLNFEIKFVMGRAAEEGYNRGKKIQGRKSHESVVSLGQTLLDEARDNDDVMPVPVVDQYIDKMDKVIALFRHGLQIGASLIAKMDDDTCGNMTGTVWEKWTGLQTPEFYYFGIYRFRGMEYDIFYGVDNTTAPFMSGPFYGLSHNLSRLIFDREYLRTTQHHVYATSSEDATVGKLVKYVENKYLTPKNESVTYDSDHSSIIFEKFAGR